MGTVLLHHLEIVTIFLLLWLIVTLQTVSLSQQNALHTEELLQGAMMATCVEVGQTQRDVVNAHRLLCGGWYALWPTIGLSQIQGGTKDEIRS